MFVTHTFHFVTDAIPVTFIKITREPRSLCLSHEREGSAFKKLSLFAVWQTTDQGQLLHDSA